MINRKNLMVVLLVYGLASLLFMTIAPARADRFYDETGKYQGRIQDNGRIYDRTGEYQGRIDRDRVYDETGEYRGRIEGSAVLDDRNEWTGSTVRSDEFYQMHRGHYPDEYEDWD